MAVATTLLGALSQLLDASPVGTALRAAGGVWVGGVPEDKPTLPFLAVLNHSEKPFLEGAPAVIEEDGYFELAVYQIGLQQAEALAGLVKALLDPTPSTAPGGRVELAIDGAALAKVWRLDYCVRLAPWKAQDGRYVYEVLMPCASFVTRHPA